MMAVGLTSFWACFLTFIQEETSSKCCARNLRASNKEQLLEILKGGFLRPLKTGWELGGCSEAVH